MLESFSSCAIFREHLLCNTWGLLKVMALLLLGVCLHLCNDRDCCEHVDEEDIIDGLGEIHLAFVHDLMGVDIMPFVVSRPFCDIHFTGFLGCKTGLGGRSGVTGIRMGFDFNFVGSRRIAQNSEFEGFSSLIKF